MFSDCSRKGTLSPNSQCILATKPVRQTEPLVSRARAEPAAGAFHKMAESHDSGAFQCEQCNQNFGNGGALSTHIRTHLKRTIAPSLTDDLRKSARIASAGSTKQREVEATADGGADAANGENAGEETGDGCRGRYGEQEEEDGGESNAASEGVSEGPEDTSLRMFDQTSKEARHKARRGPPHKSFRECLLDTMAPIEVAIFEWALKHGIVDAAVSDLQRLLTMTNGVDSGAMYDFSFLSLSVRKRRERYDAVLAHECGDQLVQCGAIVLSNGESIEVQGHDALAAAVAIVQEPAFQSTLDLSLEQDSEDGELALGREAASGSDAQFHRKTGYKTVLLSFYFDGTEAHGGSHTPFYLGCNSVSPDHQNTFPAKRVIGHMPKLPAKGEGTSEKAYKDLERELRQRYIALLLGPILNQQRGGVCFLAISYYFVLLLTCTSCWVAEGIRMKIDGKMEWVIFRILGLPLDIPAVKQLLNLYDSYNCNMPSALCQVENCDLANVSEDGLCSAEERTKEHTLEVLARGDADEMRKFSMHAGEVRYLR